MKKKALSTFVLLLLFPLSIGLDALRIGARQIASRTFESAYPVWIGILSNLVFIACLVWVVSFVRAHPLPVIPRAIFAFCGLLIALLPVLPLGILALPLSLATGIQPYLIPFSYMGLTGIGWVIIGVICY